MKNNEMIETIKTGHIAEGMLSYAILKGAKSINMKKEIWQSEVDEHWKIKCNGQDKEVDGVPAFSWYIEFNGWPAGVIGLMGDGILCAGEGGNEDNLRSALLNNVLNGQRSVATESQSGNKSL